MYHTFLLLPVLSLLQPKHIPCPIKQWHFMSVLESAAIQFFLILESHKIVSIHVTDLTFIQKSWIFKACLPIVIEAP